jgi:hypothetical protein
VRITRRGKIVRAILIGAGVIALIWLSGHVWYVPGEGYCIGSMSKCIGL